MVCKNYNEVFKLLNEIKVRTEAIEAFLRKSKTTLEEIEPRLISGKRNKDNRYIGHKTKSGTFVEFATENWIWSLMSTNHPMLILYTETIHHSKCCLCQEDDISLTAKTIKSKGKSYIIPLCDKCSEIFKVKGEYKKKRTPGKPYARVYYNAVETNRRKF